MVWVATVVLDSRAWRGNSVTACRYQQPRREPTQPVSLGVGLPLNLTTGKIFLDGTRIVAEGLVELLVRDPDRGRCASMTEVASIANETRAAMTVPLNEKCATRPGGSERCQKRKQASPTGVAGILCTYMYGNQVISRKQVQPTTYVRILARPAWQFRHSRPVFRRAGQVKRERKAKPAHWDDRIDTHVHGRDIHNGTKETRQNLCSALLVWHCTGDYLTTEPGTMP